MATTNKVAIGKATIEVVGVKWNSTCTQEANHMGVKWGHWLTGAATLAWSSPDDGCEHVVTVQCWRHTDGCPEWWNASLEGSHAIAWMLCGAEAEDDVFVSEAFPDECLQLGTAICRMLRKAEQEQLR